MNNVLDLLKGNLTSSVMEAMAKQIGGNKKSTTTATNSAIQILLSGLNRNAQKDDRNSGLLDAITKDHDGSILDNIMDFTKGQSNLGDRTTNGDGILKHILGGSLGNATEMIAKTSGLDNSKSSSLLTMLAPIVMGAVGKQMLGSATSSTNVLSDILSSSIKSKGSKQHEQSMIEKLIDQDGDGSVIDDLLSMGMKFFRRK